MSKNIESDIFKCLCFTFFFERHLLNLFCKENFHLNFFFKSKFKFSPIFLFSRLLHAMDFTTNQLPKMLSTDLDFFLIRN